jgi:hypothetical protein
MLLRMSQVVLQEWEVSSTIKSISLVLFTVDVGFYLSV